jgi:hypothetical protein
MKDVTNGQFICTVRPEKEESNQTRFTVGGDRINYPGAWLLVAKMLFNSVISTKGARFMTMDISNFYLMTPLPRHEFIRIKLNNTPRRSSLNTTSERKQQKWEHLHQSEARNVRITTGWIIGK